MATSPESFSHSPLRPIPVAEGPEPIPGAAEGSANSTDYTPLYTETSDLDGISSPSATEIERKEFLDSVMKFSEESQKADGYLDDLQAAGYPYDDIEKKNKLYDLRSEVETIFNEWDLSTTAYNAEALNFNKIHALRACAEIEVIKLAIERFAISKGLIKNDKPGEISEKDSGNEKAEALIVLYVTPAYEKLKSTEEKLATLLARKEQQVNEKIIKPDSRLDRLFGEVKDFFDTRKSKTSIAGAITTLAESIQNSDKIDGPLRLVTNKLASAEEKLTAIEKKLNAGTASPVSAEVVSLVIPEPSVMESSEVPGNVFESTPSAPTETEAIKSPERSKAELFDLYKNASHEAIWPESEKRAGRPEKSLRTIVFEIEDCLEMHGYTRGGAQDVFRNDLDPVLYEIQHIYRNVRDIEMRESKLYELFTGLLKRVAAKLNSPLATPPESILDIDLNNSEASETLDINLAALEEEAVDSQKLNIAEPLDIALSTPPQQTAVELDLNLNDHKIKLDIDLDVPMEEMGQSINLGTIDGRNQSERFEDELPHEVAQAINSFEFARARFNRILLRLQGSKKLSIALEERVTEIRSLFATDGEIRNLLWKIKSDNEDKKYEFKDCLVLSDEIENLEDLIWGMDGIESVLGETLGEETLTEFDHKFEGTFDNAEDDYAPKKEEIIDAEVMKIAHQVETLKLHLANNAKEAPRQIAALEKILEVMADIPRGDSVVALEMKRLYYKSLRRVMAELSLIKGEDYGLIAADLDPSKSQVQEAPAASAERTLYRDLNRKFNGYHEPVVDKVSGEPVIDSVTGKQKLEKQTGIREQYENALEKFYKEQSYLGQAKNYLGFKPKLPEPLISLKEEYEDMGQAYAVALDAVLRARGKDNAGVDPALAEKFIFKERRRQLNVQQEVALGKEKTSKIKPIMDAMRKHKWLIRGFTVGGYAVAGTFVVGGTALAFGGLAAARMAASIGLGGLAGKKTFGAMQSKVDEAGEKVSAAEQLARTGFSVDKLAALRRGVRTADDNKSAAEGKQRLASGVAAGAAALATGGLTGFGSSFFAGDVLTGGSAEQSEARMSTSSTGVVSDPMTGNFSAAEISPAANTAEATEVRSVTPEIKRMELVGKFKVEAEPNVAGGEAVTVSVAKIDLLGSELNIAALGTDKSQIMQYLKDRTSDFIADNPRIPQVKLEAQLLADLQNRHGSSDWWDKAKITGIDVEELREFKTPAEVVPPEANALTGSGSVQNSAPVESVRPAIDKLAEAAPANKVEMVPPAEVAFDVYKVKPGETLTKIVTEKFASDLQKLAPESRTSTVAELMNRARVDGALRDSLSLRSDGNIDRIYAGEEIKLQGLEAELQKIITERSGARISAAEEPISTRPKTGNLTVNRLDNGGSIPVRFAGVPAEPADFGASVTPERGLPVEGERQVAVNDRQFVQTVYKFPEPPKVFSLSGNFTETADYQTFIKEHYGTTQQFNKIVASEVKSFDEVTYTSLEKFMKGEGFHVSPYEKFSDMTLTQIEQFGKELNMSEFGEYKQMNYNTYKAWMDRIEDMKGRHEWSPLTKLSDLLARDVAEEGVRAMAEEKTLLRA